MAKYEVLKVYVEDGIGRVVLNRPAKANAMNTLTWREIRRAFTEMDQNPSVRCVILEGEGRNFSAGIDLGAFADFLKKIQNVPKEEEQYEFTRRMILQFQDDFSVVERCRVPIIAAIHGACFGAALDLITCCCMRFATKDARFSVKEIDLGITADLGSLQRLPRIVPDGAARELAYTGRVFNGEEAYRLGLVNNVFDTRDELMKRVLSVAKKIASKEPLAIRGIKEMVVYTRDHSIADGLNFIATWNGMLAARSRM